MRSTLRERPSKLGKKRNMVSLTLVLPPGSEALKREIIVPLILKQNSLAGLHTTPKFKTRTKEVEVITMGVNPELAKGFRSLGGFASCGARTVKVHMKHVEDGEESETVEKSEVRSEGDAQPQVTEVPVPKEPVPMKVKSATN